MLYTALNKIREYDPCRKGRMEFLHHLGKTVAGNELLSFEVILNSNGLSDALWCLRTVNDRDREIRELACDFAEHALRFVPAKEDRPRIVIETARRFARGEATKDELRAAQKAAADVDARAAERAWQLKHFIEWSDEAR